MMCPIAERIDRALGMRWLDTPGWYSLGPGVLASGRAVAYAADRLARVSI
jgi:hypothetical protein